MPLLTRFRYKVYAEKLRPLVKDTITYLHNALKEGRSILVEGANAAMLDIDFGMIPPLSITQRRISNFEFHCYLYLHHIDRHLSVCDE